jgi:hypothetical protein
MRASIISLQQYLSALLPAELADFKRFAEHPNDVVNVELEPALA